MQVQRMSAIQTAPVLFQQQAPVEHASKEPVLAASGEYQHPALAAKTPLFAKGIFHKGLLFGSKDNTELKSRLVIPHLTPGSKKTESIKKFEDAIEKLEKAAKEKGLDFHPVQIYQMGLKEYFGILARDGFPSRASHWSIGQRYHEIAVPHLKGYSQIREMVRNLTPYNKMYTLDTIPLHGKKTQTAHAIARSHIHKNNKHFKNLDGNFENILTVNAHNIEEYYEKYGRDEVEQFIDKVLMIKDMIDDDTSLPKRGAFATLELGPDKPVKDVMAYLAQTATELTPWQREVIAMIRDESYYMLPMRKTKVLGDGFAAFINRRINTRNPDLTDNKNLINEVQWITRNIFKMNEQSVNTYMLGEVILKGIEQQLIEQHGKDSPKVMEGILKVVAESDDYTLIEKHLTKEMVEDLMLYTIAPDQANNQDAKAKLKIQSKEFEQIRDSLLQQFKDHDGGAIPSVYVADNAFPVLGHDGQPRKSGEQEIKALLLEHQYEFDLRKDWAEEVLKNLELMWGNPVYLKTMIKDKDEKLHPVYIRSMLQNVEYVNEEGKPVNKHTGKVESRLPGTSRGGSGGLF